MVNNISFGQLNEFKIDQEPQKFTYEIQKSTDALE